MTNSSYDPKEYWEERMSPNTIPARVQKDVAFMRRWFGPDVEKILDYGIGKGRVLHAYRDAGKLASDFEVRGMDIVEKWEGVLRELAKSYGFGDRFDFVPADEIGSVEDNSFNLSFAIQVLMHVPKADIEETMVELARVTDGPVAATAEWFADPDSVDHHHTFAHDYLGIIQENGWQLLYWEVRPAWDKVRFAYRKR